MSNGRAADLIRLATELGAALDQGNHSTAISLQLQIAALCAPDIEQPSWAAHRLARRMLMRAGAVQNRYGTAEFLYAQREAREEIESVLELLSPTPDPVLITGAERLALAARSK